jgi:hypothetical protein
VAKPKVEACGYPASEPAERVAALERLCATAPDGYRWSDDGVVALCGVPAGWSPSHPSWDAGGHHVPGVHPDVGPAGPGRRHRMISVTETLSIGADLPPCWCRTPPTGPPAS